METIGDEMRAEARAEVWAELAAEARAEARAEGKADALTLCLVHRFGGLPEEVQGKILVADELQLECWLIKAVDASTLDAVFSGLDAD